MKELYSGKTILVTGGTGSIGSALVEGILPHNPASIRVLTNDEDSLHRASQQWDDPRIRHLLGDIRSKDRIRRAMKDVDIVFHAAALKHVPFCELNPFEAVEVNVLGTQNIVDAAMEAEVDAVIAISTDKAVNPINTMGATKLLSEKLVLDANLYKGRSRTRFWCVRFGNVLNSRGSIIPVVKERIQSGQNVHITDPEMTRFVLPIEEATRVVLSSLGYCKGGEVIVPKQMDSVRIGDLVDVLIGRFAPASGRDVSQIKVDFVGPRAGEKTHEMLFTEEEAPWVQHGEDAYILPRLPSNQPGPGLVARSDEAPLRSASEIEALLDQIGVS